MLKTDQQYINSVNQLQKIIELPKIPLRPEGKSLLFAQKTKAKDVIILFHGFTNCPKQFEIFGKILFKLGYTVYIPRAPHHGLKDRLTKDLQNVTVKELIDYGNQAVDDSRLLGKRVSVMGISAGGAIACYLAQTRSDITVTMPIAPMLGFSFLPPQLTKLFEIALSIVPNYYMWWDPRTKDTNTYSVNYAYPGYPTKSLLEITKLGLLILDDRFRSPIKAERAVLVINEKEPGVSNPAIMQLYTTWKGQRGNAVSLAPLPAVWKLPHDCITPGTPGLDLARVYATLILALQKALAHV